MSKPTAVIIEDEFFAANHISSLIKDQGFHVKGIYHSGEEFLDTTDWNFDLAIVDIFLSKSMSGLELASHLNQHFKPFIFLTANQDGKTLKEAARLNPKSYITKPFKENDVIACLQMIQHELAPKIEVRGKSGIEEISADNILFIKGDGAYIDINTTEGVVIQRKLLKDIEMELPDNFIRIHRSYLVNKHYIEEKGATHILLKGEKLPISRSYREEI